MADEEQQPFDPEEQLAQMRAAFDQAKAFMPEMAGLLGEYGRALAQEGFSADQILTLCVNMQTSFFTMGMLGGGS